MRRFLLFMLLVSPLLASAQKKDGTLVAEIIHKESGEPLIAATLRMHSLPDSVFKVGAASDVDGKINTKVKPGKYYVLISYVGCEHWKKDVVIEEGKLCDLGRVLLADYGTMLDEAVVSAEVPPVTVSEDTLVYNTAAFRVPEGSMLEELIKKYPGVTIEDDGTIKINGKTVNRILMKGKDFFGTDKDMALKNISVDVVDKVKFYDKKSDFARMTGIDDGEEETVLDLQMKKGVTDGLFSNTDAGYGTKDRYSVRNTTGYYTDNSQYMLVLSANNLNNQGFSDGRGRGFGGGGSGLVAPKQGGFNFAMETEKMELGGNVRVNHRASDSKNWRSSENFMPQMQRSQFSNSRNTSFGSSSGVNADLRLEWKPDTLTNIVFRPSFSYSASDSWSQGASAVFDADPFEHTSSYEKWNYGDVFGGLDTIAVNSNRSESQSNSRNMSFGANLQVNRRLGKPGRNITFRGNFSYNDSRNKSFSTNDVRYYQASLPDVSNKRYTITPGTRWNYDLRLSYTEPIIKNLFLQLSYSYSQSYDNNDRSAYVFDNLTGYEMLLHSNYELPLLPPEYEQCLSDSLSRYSTYRTNKHNVQLTLRYVTSKMNVNAGVGWEPMRTELDYKYQGADTLFARNVHNITPNVRFQYKWSKTTTLNIRYRGTTSQPSMTDLVDVTDDSNPLYITKGNPSLRPSFSNNVNAFFNTYNADAQRGFNAFVGYNNVLNSISRKATYIEETGVTISQPDNINGNWSVNGGFSFNSAIPANTKFTYNTFTDARYSNSVSYISMRGMGSQKSVAKTLSLSERLSGNYRADNFDVSISGFIRYSNSSATAQPGEKMNVFDFSYGPSANYTLPWYNIKISTNISMSSRRGYSNPEANTDELLWNAQLSASFLKQNALTASVQFHDILHQQSNISRVVDALSRSDSEVNAIYSYIMFNLSYKFNNTGGKNKDKERKGNGMRGYGMPGNFPPPPAGAPAGMPGGGGFRPF